MGVYYQATTIIGFEISTANFFYKETKPNCSHNPSGTFCEECGKKAGFKTNIKSKQEYWLFRDHFLPTLRKDFVWAQQYDRQGDLIWIGYGNHADQSEALMAEPRAYDTIKAELTALLEPYTSAGLVVLDESKFGIWTLNMGS